VHQGDQTIASYWSVCHNISQKCRSKTDF